MGREFLESLDRLIYCKSCSDIERGAHQYLSININAYIAYDPATGAGIRPNGINENVYQFQSGGVYNQNQLMLNYTVRARKVSLFGFYVLSFAKADTSGATYNF